MAAAMQSRTDVAGFFHFDSLDGARRATTTRRSCWRRRTRWTRSTADSGATWRLESTTQRRRRGLWHRAPTTSNTSPATWNDLPPPDWHKRRTGTAAVKCLNFSIFNHQKKTNPPTLCQFSYVLLDLCFVVLWSTQSELT